LLEIWPARVLGLGVFLAAGGVSGVLV
jgi:hypothetical protein